MNMSGIKVSIIVPIFNCEIYLSKCIESILSQSLKEIEVILINDGSSDGSGIIADKYARKDAKVKVIHQMNSGPGASRNKGIEVARGEYIGFVDSDDSIDPIMYEHLYQAASGQNAHIAMCSYVEELPNQSIVINHPFNNHELIDKKNIEENIITSFATNINYGYYSLCNKIYKKEWLLENKLRINEEREHGEDWWFNLEALSLANRVIFVNGAYYHYVRLKQDSLMSKYNEYQFELFLSGRTHLIKTLKHGNVDISKYKKELDKRFVEECVGFLYKVIINESDRLKAAEIARKIETNDEFRSALQNYVPDSLTRRILTILLKLQMLTSLRLMVLSIDKAKRILTRKRLKTNH